MFNTGVDKDVVRLGKRVLKVYKEQDNDVENKAKASNASCREGCSHCCYLLTFVSLPEAAAIAEHLYKDNEMWATEMETLLAKLYRHIEVLSDPSKAPESGKGLPCMFLDTNTDRCRIYEVRPSACRYHYVSSDPVNCKTELDLEPTVIDMSSFALKVRQAAEKVSKQVGTKMHVAPMAVAVSWALKALTEGKEVLRNSSGNELGALNLELWEKFLNGESQEEQKDNI